MSNSMTAAQAAQQNNRGPGGQYSFGTHAEPEGVALPAGNAPSRPGKLHDQYGIGLDHPSIDAFNQLEGLRSASTEILKHYPQAHSLKLEHNQDGENQWDVVEATDASGTVLASADDLDELTVDNSQLGDIAGAIWQLDKNYPHTGPAGVMNPGNRHEFATLAVDLRSAANPEIDPALLTAVASEPDATGPHPEDALSNAGASDGFFEIVGATCDDEVATIDLSTTDQTGGLLRHDYKTGETTWKWDDEDLGFGSSEDVDIAIEDITHGQKNAKELFEAFRLQMSPSAGHNQA